MFSLVDHLPSIHQHTGADTLRTTVVLFTQPPLRRQRPCQDLNRWLVDSTLQRRQFSTSSAVSSSIKAAAIESNIYSQHLRIKHASTLIPWETLGVLSEWRRSRQVDCRGRTQRSKAPHSLALPGAIWRLCSFMARPMFPEILSFPWKNAWGHKLSGVGVGGGAW